MKRIIAVAVLLLLIGVAVEGGTYGTRDLLALRRQVRDEKERIATLRREVDSLARLERALRTDNDTLERVAREAYGMIRPGEHLYQVVRPDSSR